MIVKLLVQNIGGKGKGLIAGEFIKKGQAIFDEKAETKLVFKKKNEFDLWAKNQTHQAIQDFCKYAYGKDQGAIYLLDDSRFCNHSEIPNMWSDDLLSYASRDIQPGEEILDNYFTYDNVEWLNELAKKYGTLSCSDFALWLRNNSNKN